MEYLFPTPLELTERCWIILIAIGISMAYLFQGDNPVAEALEATGE